MLTEALHQQRELFGLRTVHPLVNRIQHLGGLFNHGQRGANGGVRTALAHLQLRSATHAHSRLAHVLYQRHQRAGRFLVGQRHNRIADLLAPSLDLCAAPWRDAEDVGVLARTDIADQEAGEVGVHASIQQLPPRGGDRVGGVAEDVQKPNVVEPKPRHERVLDKRGAGLRQHPSFGLVVVAGDGQDFARRHINGHAVRDFQPSDLALELVFKLLDVQFAVDFVNLAVTVIGVGGRGGDALL